MSTLRDFLRDDSGQGLAEYGLILLLVSVAAFATLTTLGGTISGIFTTVTSDL